MSKRGAFLVFEGCDRSGKSTQSRLMFELLQKNGVPAIKINFPDRSTVIGDVINNYLQKCQELSDEVIHLLFSANRWERVKSIEKHLLAGTTVICDRYAHSGAAYSMAKGLDAKWCLAADQGLVKPDAVIYLKAKPEKLKERGNYGEERYDKVEFQRKVSAIYDRFSEQEVSYWHQFDASESPERLHAQIAAIATQVLERASELPLAKLN